jgi:hypothetical protein
MIAVCGINCAECDCYLATQSDNPEMREKVAAKISEETGKEVKPEDINCNGCHAGGKCLYKACTECEMRDCAYEKGYRTCAECLHYSCDRLNEFHTMVPAARSNLEALHIIMLK